MESNSNREPMTLDEIGALLMKAIRKLSEKERVEGMSEPKMGPTQFKAEIERLQREGKMPSLEAVLAAIAETRAEYREKILAARKSRKTKRRGR